MPLYIYGCPTCEIVIEALRPMELADFPPVECPVCHGLCEREVAQVNVIRSTSSRDDDVVSVAPQVAHPPGCPCCRPFPLPASAPLASPTGDH